MIEKQGTKQPARGESADTLLMTVVAIVIAAVTIASTPTPVESSSPGTTKPTIRTPIEEIVADLEKP